MPSQFAFTYNSELREGKGKMRSLGAKFTPGLENGGFRNLESRVFICLAHGIFSAHGVRFPISLIFVKGRNAAATSFLPSRPAAFVCGLFIQSGLGVLKAEKWVRLALHCAYSTTLATRRPPPLLL